MMAWLIAAERIGVLAPPAENQGPWFTHKYDQEWNLNGELPLVQMLKDLPSRVRQDGPLAPQWEERPITPEKLGRDWDFRLNFLGAGVKLEAVGGPEGDEVSGPYWELVKASWLNLEEARGSSQVLVKALDADGNPIENAEFSVGRIDAQDPVRTKGPVDQYWGNYAMYGLLGTYSVEMTEGGYPSDRVTGVGLGTEEVPDAWASTAFHFTFRLMGESGDVAADEETGSTIEESPGDLMEEETDVAVEPVDPPTADGAPPVEEVASPVVDEVEVEGEESPVEEEGAMPVVDTAPVEEVGHPEGITEGEELPSEPTTHEELDPKSLHHALFEAAQPHIIPLNPDAAFYKYARQHDLGERLTREYYLEHEGVEYAYQVYEKGLVYAPVGHWDQVTHVEREN
jgi:hypothetical protein